MSYTDQPVSRGRTYAIVIVALLHALLAYAFVTGLAYRFVKGLNPDMKTFDVKEEPPPPPEEPPPPPPGPLHAGSRPERTTDLRAGFRPGHLAASVRVDFNHQAISE